MEKENKKMKKEMHKKEEKRIQKLVSLAYNNDFRLKKFESQREQEKRDKKEQIK